MVGIDKSYARQVLKKGASPYQVHVDIIARHLQKTDFVGIFEARYEGPTNVAERAITCSEIRSNSSMKQRHIIC